MSTGGAASVSRFSPLLLALTLPVLAGCGASESEAGEPVQVAACSDLIRAQLELPDSFQFRAAEDERSYRRFTRIIFRANIPSRSGPELEVAPGPGSATTCQALCRISEDGELESLGGITEFGGEPTNAGRCLAARPREEAR